ncbi:MAG: hypothetical protein KDK76_07865 [Chlamydiia bacterium]|nr:hypothetical protein [Chlamydiia bacterium]
MSEFHREDLTSFCGQKGPLALLRPQDDAKPLRISAFKIKFVLKEMKVNKSLSAGVFPLHISGNPDMICTSFITKIPNTWRNSKNG